MFGDQVRQHRLRLGFSQEDLAQRAGVHPKTVRNIEAGRHRARPSTTRLLADALDLDGPERAHFLATSTARPADARAHRGRPAVVPAQLPPDVSGFVGRSRELDRLNDLIPDTRTHPVVIAAVSGMAGVGKTSLAVHWAHRVANRFPDGQLYVNLHGFDPDGRAMADAEALRVLVDGLGVPTTRIPVDRDAQIGLYRSVLAGKRMLIVLDNARDAEQVRPLLPGSPTTMVLVTSRDHLTSLTAIEGAFQLTVGLLSPVETRELLAHRLGADKVGAEPGAVDAIAAACAGLPLALVIDAARAQQIGLPLAVIASELQDAGRRLDLLDAGDRISRIRSVLSWSYRRLTPAAAGLFRLLGSCPGPEISAAAAASLAGRSLPDTRRLLAELVLANLLTEHATSRYTLHDLLRVYADDLARRSDSATARREATARLLDHYVRAAHAAEQLLHPLRDPIELPLDEARAGVVIEHIADREHAATWFDTEHQVLVTALRYAADTGFERVAWQLAWATDTFLTRRGDRHALARAWQTALHASRRLDDEAARAYAHRALAVASIELGQYGDAHRHVGHALELYVRIADRVGQARTRRDLAYLRWREGDSHGALRDAKQALALYRAAGHQHGVANELNGVGWYYAEIGDSAQALVHCRQALTLLERLGDQVGAAYAWDSVGYAHHNLGEHAEAIACYHRALALHRQLGDRHDEADTLTRLGDTHHARGRLAAARGAWRDALDILTDIDHPDAHTVRTRLDAPPASNR